jgi:hypothetical protein
MNTQLHLPKSGGTVDKSSFLLRILLLIQVPKGLLKEKH